MNTYQEFIAKSRYSRYLPMELRREHWSESTQRWADFFKEELSNKLSPEHPIWNELRQAMTDLEVLPSMRSVMTAGEALRRTNVAAYNCAYLPVDSPRSFDEAMYILLCGTGVGFSVEAEYVKKLPPIPYDFRTGGKTIVVEDSKEGWCHAYRTLLDNLWRGIVCDWDVSGVRPAGAPLKTFGGRASGPEPLVSLFEYTRDKFFSATSEKMSTMTAHDIMCKIGEVVVVGGVRRSAMISLGDLADTAHAHSKADNWWESAPERALANNSAVYNEKPSIGDFMKEWLSIYNSKSGERGIFNRQASQKQAAKFGRREENIDYGTNPCSEIILKPYQFCNLSTIVVRADDDLKSLQRKVVYATIMGTMQATLVKFPYLRDIWRQNTQEEALLGVSMTGIYSNELLVSSPDRDQILKDLRTLAFMTNRYWSGVLDINPAAAITCVKPEGTVSQLTLTPSGIHPDHAPFYTRRVRQDNKDPLTKFMISKGIPNEPCVMKPNDTTVFSFLMRAKGLTRRDVTAIQHLELWLAFQRNWCEHKPSVTISVKEHEWMEVGAWVYKHFDECTGVSFLPDDGGSYKQAPYEEMGGGTYQILNEGFPKIDWDDFQEFEDRVEGVQTLACTAGACQI
jgi:ribonucleoside-diphosphate reductase alpha chain